MFGRCKILEPDQTADLARVYSFWRKHLIWAHMTELRLKAHGHFTFGTKEDMRPGLFGKFDSGKSYPSRSDCYQ